MILIQRFFILFLFAVPLFASGFANVKPWDRDFLAEDVMRPDRDRLARATREHLWFSREAANGGRSIGGGGCGCN